MYAAHPALGYFDHPPMVAWGIHLGTALLGHNEFAVRLPTLLLSLGTAVLLYKIAQSWFGTRSAWWTIILFSVAPIYAGCGVLAFPDGPLIFFWSLTLWALTRALREPVTSWGWWLLAGIGVGCAMLSKYTAVMLGASFLIFILAVPRHRHWLRRPQPWVMALLGAALFTPVLIWNWQHDWASLLFQSSRTATSKHHPLVDVPEFWLLQILMLSPGLFALLALALQRVWRQIRQKAPDAEAWIFAASFALPLFAMFILASTRTGIRPNWTAPVFLSLLPAAGVIMDAGLSSVRAPRWRGLAWINGAACFLVALVAISTLTFGIPRAWVYRMAGSWHQMAALTVTAHDELRKETGRDPFVLGADRYYLAAGLGFYLNTPNEVVNLYALDYPGLSFRYWTDLNRWTGAPAIVVMHPNNTRVMSELKDYFETVGTPKEVGFRPLDGRKHRLWMVKCYNYSPLKRTPATPTTDM